MERKYLRTCAGCGNKRWLLPGRVCKACLGVPKKRPITTRKLTPDEREAALDAAAACRVDARVQADAEIMARLAAAKQGRLI